MAADDRPNILLIMAEDLSPRIGAYGDKVARTPNIDRLASESVRYTNAHTTAGVCAPSRAGMIMGAHQNHWGAGHMRAHAGGYVAVPPEDWKAFPELLRRAGYWVVNNGKTDYQMGSGVTAAFSGPFSVWDETSGEDWRGRAEGQPFFAYLTLAQSHESQVWPTWHMSLMGLVMGAMRLPNHFSWDFETDPSTVVVPPYYPDTPTVRADIARHYNNIGNVDRLTGELLAKLEADGLAENTLVFWTTDHGDGLPRAKRWLYDSGTHVPLLVRWPGHTEPGAVVDELVSGIDYAPTFFAAAGVARAAQFEGRNLLGEGAGPEPAYLYAARDRIDERPDTVRAVRDRRYLYIRNLVPDQPYVLDIAFRNEMPMMQEMLERHEAGELHGVPAQWFRPTRDTDELYDTKSDPHQIRNLAADPAYEDILARLSAVMDERLAEERDLGLLPEERLRERNWPGGEQPVTPVPEFTARAGRATLAAQNGASIGFRLDGSEHWQLYTKPLALAPESTLEAKAVRYGWAESDIVEFSAP
jgi:arylsulfatase A-like enzyme